MNVHHRLRDIAVVILVLCVPASAFAATVLVNGDANIFGAGHASPSAPAGGGAGTLPPSLILGPVGNVLNFSVTGTVTYNGGGNFYDADGGQYIGGSTNMSSFGGISGIQHGSRTMFLIGVFTDGTEPAGGGPSILDFTSDGFASVAPLLNQTFFIGDGLTGTGSGSVQQFYIPTGATQLFFGFADGIDFAGQQGTYGDDSGTLTVNASQVPEPSRMFTICLGLVAIAMHRKRVCLGAARR